MNNSEISNSNLPENPEATTPSVSVNFNKWLKTGLLALVGLIVCAGLLYAGYWYSSRATQQVVIQPVLTPTVGPTIPHVAILPPNLTITEEVLESPSPALISVEEIQYRPNPSWQTYNDFQAKFSVQYPQSYKLNNSIPGESASFLSCVNDPQRGEICLSGYQIGISYDYDGGSRRQWLYKKGPEIQNFLINPYFSDFMVNRFKSLVIMDGNTGGSTGSWVLIPRENMMYLFSFPFGWNPDTGDKSGLVFIKQILSTFRFLE